MLSVCLRAPAKHLNKTSLFLNWLQNTILFWVTLLKHLIDYIRLNFIAIAHVTSTAQQNTVSISPEVHHQ